MEQLYLDIISGNRTGIGSSAVRGMLSVAEIPYRLAMQLRNRRYDSDQGRSHDLGRPTISVGNITAGGTGKTPVVQWLVEALVAAGQKPAVLMRGYRKAGSLISDEQIMLQQLLPGTTVEANPDRVAGAQSVLAREPETSCFVLDDGFQHRRARRSFDMVLVHAAQPFGFGHVHPRGLLREPLCGLGRASAILITHASETPPEQTLRTQETIRVYSDAPIFHCDHVNETIVSGDDAQVRELSDLATLPFVLMTGIGQPQPLAASLKRFPASYMGERFFDDHHHYTAEDLRVVAEVCRKVGAEAVVTTEKDWVKLKPLWQAEASMPGLYRLRLGIRLWEEEEEPLLKLILSSLRR